MLVVYVEMWPGGDQSKAYPLGSLAVSNVTQPGDLLDNYQFEIDEAAAPQVGIERLEKKGVILAHNRRQSVWKLIRRAIDTVFPPIIT
jgi:hypothetical protein